MAHGNFSNSYKSFQDNIVSMYKSWFTSSSLKKIGDGTLEHKLAKQQAENLKWQQNMFHKIVHAAGLQREGIISEKQFVATRIEILDALIASPAHGESSAIIRDKLLFLQELLYAKCISEDDYHQSKRPLLMRLAVHGAQIDSRDVVLGTTTCPNSAVTVSIEPRGMPTLLEASGHREKESEWSDVDFKDDDPLRNNGSQNVVEDKTSKITPMKQVMSAMSRFGLASNRGGMSKGKNNPIVVPRTIDLQSSKEGGPMGNSLSLHVNATDSFSENPFCQAAGMVQTSDQTSKDVGEGGSKRIATRTKVQKAFNRFFTKKEDEITSKEKETENEESYASVDTDSESELKPLKSQTKRHWGFELFRSQKTTENAGGIGYVPLNDNTVEDDKTPPKLIQNPIGMGPNTKNIKKRLHSDGPPTDFFIDKFLGENIRSELSRIRAEMGHTNGSESFTNEQIDAIANKLPVDKNELKKFLPQSWCERYGDIVLDVVHKEFKVHVDDMDNLRKASLQKRQYSTSSKDAFGKFENSSPGIYMQGWKTKSMTPKRSESEMSARLLNDENAEPGFISSKSPMPRQLKVTFSSPSDHEKQPLARSNLYRDRYRILEERTESN